MPVDRPSLLVMAYEWGDEVVIVVNNLSPDRVIVNLDRPDLAIVDELAADADYDRVPGGGCDVEVAGFGYRWFRGRP